MIFIYVSSKFSLFRGKHGVKSGVKWVINCPISHKSHIEVLYLGHSSYGLIERCNSDIHLWITQIYNFSGLYDVKLGVKWMKTCPSPGKTYFLCMSGKESQLNTRVMKSIFKYGHVTYDLDQNFLLITKNVVKSKSLVLCIIPSFPPPLMNVLCFVDTLSRAIMCGYTKLFVHVNYIPAKQVKGSSIYNYCN